MLFSEEKYDELSSQEITEKQDVSREGLTWAKVSHFVKVLFSKKATACLEDFSSFQEIDFDVLKHINGKKGIILDIDECVSPHHWDVLPENFETIWELLTDDWDILVYSNMKKTSRYEQLEELWINVVTSEYAKPDERWFEECVEYFAKEVGLTKRELIMIWDNFLTDWWAIAAWIDFIKVKPIETLDEIRSLARKIQLKVRCLVDNRAAARWNIKKENWCKVLKYDKKEIKKPPKLFIM